MTKIGVLRRAYLWLMASPPSAEEKAAVALTDFIKDQRSPNPNAEAQLIGGVVDVGYDYRLLKKLSIVSEVLRVIHEAIIREVLRNGYELKEKYACKCLECGAEYQVIKKKCSTIKCESTQFLYPEYSQRTVAQAFLDQPNRDDQLSTINESLLRYMLSTDDYWLSYQTARIEKLQPATVHVEDSEFMRVLYDKGRGVIGNGEYFCPLCTANDPGKTYNKGEKCPKHPDQELKESTSAYVNGSTIEARFARDEIYHGISHPWLPGFYGVSIIISALVVTYSIMSMNDFNYRNYSTGKLAQILNFEGLSPEEATSLAQEVAKQREAATKSNDKQMLRTLFLGSKGRAENIDTMPDPSKMQSLDWWKLWRELLCSMYGVTPIYTGVVEQGKSGNNPRMQIDVNNNQTEFNQHKLEDVYNLFVFPRLGVTDWLYVCRPVEEKDEMQDVSILQAKLQAIQTAISLGMDAELTDEQEVKISGKPLTLEEKNEMQMEKFQQMQQSKPNQQGEEKPAFEGNKPFKKENVFPTEKGSTWIVKEVKEEEKS